MAGGLGAVPVDRIGFEGATVRFDDAGKCAVAGGRIRLVVSAPIAGLDLSRGLSGPLSCANGRAQAALASQSGMERLTLSFDGSCAYRAQFAIPFDRDPAMAAALAALGRSEEHPSELQSLMRISFAFFCLTTKHSFSLFSFFFLFFLSFFF